jgi:purine-nucleoside phosphorylase
MSITPSAAPPGSLSASSIEIIRSRGVVDKISFGIVLGTGLVRLGDEVEDAVAIPYTELPGFPDATVSGHPGRLVIGRLAGKHVALMQGRGHYYETGNAQVMRPALETLAGLGASTVMLTNAAGSLHADWVPGTLSLIRDHINFSGSNPLMGEMGDQRFVNMTDAYDAKLRRRLRIAASHAGVNINEGVYMWFSGPTFETPAEIKMAKLLGADLVGMSTVPEVILARLLGLNVCAISVITNLGAGILGAKPSHGETKEVALSGSVLLKRLLLAFLKLPEDY